MKVAIVFNHPYERSYCNAILHAVTNGIQKAHHEVDLFHLDNDGFNPVLTKADLKAFVDRKPIDPKVIEYTERLEKADHLVGTDARSYKRFYRQSYFSGSCL